MGTIAGLTYAPNISWLLPELPSGERPRALADAGFTAFEFGFPSAVDVETIDEARQEYGLDVILFNQDVPVWDRSHRGYLSDPRQRDEFRRRLDEALSLAGRLRAHKVMLPAGVEIPDVGREHQRDLIVENLRYAGPLAEQAGVMLTVEVINPHDHPGYYLTSSPLAVDIVQTVAHPRVRFQFDTYHLQRMEGNLAETIRRQAAWIGHVQFGDYPDRGQPGTGTIDFDTLLHTLQSVGYEGYVGLEFAPRDQGLQALAWVPEGMRARGDAARGASSQDREKRK